MRAERISDDLRLGNGEFLRRRRRIAALTLISAAAYGVVGAYQFGLVRHVPEPSTGPFAADRVDAGGEAYVVLGMPDAALGIVNAGITLMLAGAGDEQRWAERPWLPLLLAGKVAADAAGGALLFGEQVSRHRKLCSWCTLAAVAGIAAVPQAVSEARAAWTHLRGHR